MTSPGAHSFASDNYSGVHPEVLAAIARANVGHAPAYGADPWTARAEELLRRHLGEQAAVALVFNGSGANVVGLGLLLRPWEHVICAAGAHISVDECGAPERILGSKTVPVPPTPDGKLTPELVRAARTGIGFQHATQPRVVSISQTTELGTVYTPAEIGALAETAHEFGMYLHLDGARLANAAVALGVDLAAAGAACGVDVLSFGGTKNGLLGAEAVVVLRPELEPALAYTRKQCLQLGSKGRFLAAQFIALLEDDLWRRNAEQANRSAARLGAAVQDVVTVTRPVEANVVFARLDADRTAELRRTHAFYQWGEGTGEVRWMCSWDTTDAEVDAFADRIRTVAAGSH